MRLTISAIGRLKAGAEHSLVETYLERARPLARQAGITAITVREQGESTAATPALRRAEEAGRLIHGLPPSAVLVALDEHGQSLTSEDFAQRLCRLAGEAGDVAFLLGGPDGHDPDLLGRAGLVLAFGPMTWPHRLARVMLAEQVYRAVTILVNHPYHRA
jgi:23S rRNA (pseudouridine1915-N3)-methyltransferase